MLSRHVPGGIVGGSSAGGPAIVRLTEAAGHILRPYRCHEIPSTGALTPSYDKLSTSQNIEALPSSTIDI